MARTKEQTLLNEILVWLAAEQRRWLQPMNGDPSRDVYELHNKLATIFPLFDEWQLEQELNRGDEIEFLQLDRFLHLPPIEKGGGFLPVMALKYNFSHSQPEIRFRVALFCQYREELKASGFRFETPEGLGKHNFFHLQQITGFDKDTHKYQLPCEPWIPVKQPAFCLDATEPISLLLTMLVSLYGFDYIGKLRSKGFGQGLKPYIEKTSWYNLNPSVSAKG